MCEAVKTLDDTPEVALRLDGTRLFPNNRHSIPVWRVSIGVESDWGHTETSSCRPKSHSDLPVLAWNLRLLFCSNQPALDKDPVLKHRELQNGPYFDDFLLEADV